MRVAVLGGGAAGLAAGAALRRAGVEVSVFEAEPSAGGKLRTVERDGFRCEDGPNALTAQSTTALRVARAHGLEIAEARPPRTRFVARQGRVVALAPPRLVRLLSMAGWARLALEPFAAQRHKAVGEESLRAFLVRHLGREAGELGASLLANGVYAGDPEALSARQAFPRLSALEERGPSLLMAGFRRGGGQKTLDPGAPRSLWIPAKGMSALIGALSDELAGSLRLGSRVRELKPSGPSGYELQVEDGQRIRFDGAVCALPPTQAFRLLAPLTPGAEGLREIRSSPLTVVHLGFRREDLGRAARGFGILDGDGSLGMLGTLFPSSLFAGRAPAGRVLFTCLLGGMQHPEVARFDEEALGSVCRAALGRLFGISGEPVFTHVARWSEAVPQPELGHAARLSRVREALRALPPLELAGAAYGGVGVEQVLVDGERAAEQLLARLSNGSEVHRVVDPVIAPVEDRPEV